jgi:hypothetical protein
LTIYRLNPLDSTPRVDGPCDDIIDGLREHERHEAENHFFKCNNRGRFLS